MSWSRLRSALRRRPGLLWWPLLIVVLVAASLLIFWSVDPDAQDWGSRLLGELAAALLGSAVAAVAATFGYYLALSRTRRQRQERRETARSIERSMRERKVRIGRMTIDDIVVLEASQRLDSFARHVTVEFEPTVDQQRPNDDLKVALKSRLAKLEAQAETDNRVFKNDLGVDIVGASIVDRGRAEPSRRVYRLTPAFLRYYDWAVTSNLLDQELTSEDRAALMALGDSPLMPKARRNALNLRSMARPVSMDGLESLSDQKSPWPAKLSVGVAVLSSDQQILLGLRSEATYVASRVNELDSGERQRVHVVAEGAEPQDKDLVTLSFSPDATARRAIAEEMGLDAGPAAGESSDSLIATALFIDTQRLQPCFGYLHRAGATASDIIGALPCARDSWEARRLISMPVDAESHDLTSLLLDEHPEYLLASNHAKAYLYFAMQYLLGFGEMRHLLEGYRSR